MGKAIDILLYVALSEEFDVVIDMLGSDFKSQEQVGVALTGFFGNIDSPVLNRSFEVAVFPAGKMGNTRSASLTSALIEKLNPANIVVLGIAGSLVNDMEPGDVFIPDTVNEYMANSATHGEGKNWSFTTSGNQFQSSLRLLNRFQFFAHTSGDYYKRWQQDTQIAKAELISEEVQLALASNELILRGSCKLFAGDDRKLASGPAVGKGKGFVDWIIREHDRKVAALEMESAGVYDAATVRTTAPRTVAIRGISDYADARKEKIEDTAKGKFRNLSARNAVSFFIHTVQAGMFGAEEELAQVALSPSPHLQLDSRVKSVFVIGGHTGETADVDAELPRLNKASLTLGHVLAKAGAQLLICSPFTDSVDYYAAMGYADSKCGGLIQFHSPSHPTVEEKRCLLRKTLGRPGLVIQDWNYPGPEGNEEDAWFQSWFLAQIQALEKADVVVALGGKVSQTASTLLHLAEARGLPIIPFAFLGGVAKRSYERRDWSRLNPGFDPSVLCDVDGVEHTIEIANRLMLDRMQPSRLLERPKMVFVSFAHQDAEMANALRAVLVKEGIEVLVGDDEIRSDQMITAIIEQAVLRSDVCAVLWSRQYAQSPWCYDEMSLAINQQEYGKIKVWLFNLDDSPIVPAQARKLPTISVRNVQAMHNCVHELLGR
ncbi:TPA: TIR domain-containing protein [Escherichia coli]|nr:TIR domain-containing protein [Escherichia coli]EGO5210877.1 TIR domain-containing protein [Escherichia coli]EHL1197789.1 TIR domain-containing protein [Escherichia coli]EHO7999430.1 TIR domain-containing protein [Escherichia coli]EHY2526402.1 TIR domain-containing protein [Escherichia coli]